MRQEVLQIDLKDTYPDECPKCHSKNVMCMDWKDAYIIWLHITCQNYRYRWHEIIDLTI